MQPTQLRLGVRPRGQRPHRGVHGQQPRGRAWVRSRRRRRPACRRRHLRSCRIPALRARFRGLGPLSACARQKPGPRASGSGRGPSLTLPLCPGWTRADQAGPGGLDVGTKCQGRRAGPLRPRRLAGWRLQLGGPCLNPRELDSAPRPLPALSLPPAPRDSTGHSRAPGRPPEAGQARGRNQ